MTKLRIFLRSYAGVLIGIGFLAVITMASGIYHYNSEQVTSKSVPSAYIETKPEDEQNKSTVESPSGPPVTDQINDVPTATRPAESQPTPAKTSTQPTQETVSQPKPEPAEYTVSLSVNGNSKGSFTVLKETNHCSVLTTALSKGYISSLDMRYNSQYNTNAVYVIDGIGQPDSVWWVYTVNGKSPPVGCTQLQVKNGDNINWKYTK